MSHGEQQPRRQSSAPWPPGYMPGMEHFWPQPKPPSWARRHYKALWALGALALIAAVTVLGYASSGAGAPRDYRDPLKLSGAVKEHYGAQTAGCSKKPDGTYFCIVVGTDGAGASYNVTVSPDGHSWSAS